MVKTVARKFGKIKGIHGDRSHDSTVLSLHPYNGEIATITETDTNKHFLDLSTVGDDAQGNPQTPINCVGVILWCNRQSGSLDSFNAYIEKALRDEKE